MLAYHFDTPLSDLTDSIRYRLEGWYPSTWGLQYPQYAHVGRFKNPRVSVRSMITGNDTAKSAWHMNGPRVFESRESGLSDALFAGTSPVIAQLAATEADKWLESAPNAWVELSLVRTGNRVKAAVKVDSIVGERNRLSVRIVLYEDTVRVRGGTNRRVYTNVVRRAAGNKDHSLGLPISESSPSTTAWTFDLAEIQRTFLVGYDPKKALPYVDSAARSESIKLYKEWSDRFPDVNDWKMDLSHLHIVAFVQDLDTGEILQGAELKVPRSDGKMKIAR
jgi:hypothetical protein